MACRIPGCVTNYWNKENRAQMFAANGKQILAKWQEILKIKYGIENFDRLDRICILHFSENAIERTYRKYSKGGVYKEVEFSKPKLCFGALPTIFPSEIPRKSHKKKKADYAVEILDPEILRKQREMFEESKQDKALTIKTEVEIKSELVDEA